MHNMYIFFLHNKNYLILAIKTSSLYIKYSLYKHQYIKSYYSSFYIIINNCQPTFITINQLTSQQKICSGI
ncbi:hypothetical protein HMPREF0080_00203 [Anaeroglobus geminatus F0357]|uniref:Uncharacterized protein n=1 Tax=Anaeroglobus geminatus F0357 TaxID=861450 RepID=G9YEZ3_9FIRM|nr:hypothetical protein HMPREF0080_00203 [Anaeroglobus geminatus F0357]